MSGSIAYETARRISEEVLAARDLELVEITLQKEGRDRVLRITLDSASEPLGVDEIALVSEEISRALDLEDPIEGRYMLEVASAGLERPLMKPGDYVRFTGKEISVKTTKPIEGRRTFAGSIAQAGGETFVVTTSEGVVEIPYVSVARARLIVDWDAELRKVR